MEMSIDMNIDGDSTDMFMQLGLGNMNMTATAALSGVLDRENEQLQMEADVSYSIGGMEDSVGEL